MNNYDEKLQENKNKIMENIEYGRSVGINKISAIFAIEDEDKEALEKELINWLILEGYKVSLIQDEMKILVIELT
ncbi:hypothetical protein H7E67_00720 [Clostridium gasigenes]|uniref:Uncharacterized protein n=2 Tax=Clostridium gasigenes TaxID=94869 RepID=A0A7X0SII6_9CLOT|nr:hypothetical protein [Clostridium gasigenes]MBB6716096.1 hypothetical protein [Clostridium gasigenes]MBU3089792.1 hypothetical protein [Clostridium gasigenes]MBU3102748.1 hypothetical protein [Clostridium gasigenes]MBU3106460.1 hypothetical protein [Clostridium gasigenes]